MPVIIHVDDNPSTRAHMQTVVDKAFEFFGFKDSCDALKFLEHRGTEVDAVIADARMTNIRGMQFLRMVAAKWPSVARILSISKSDIEFLCDYVNGRHIDCVIKSPLEPENVAGLINDCIAQKKLAAQSIDFRTIEENLQLDVLRAELAAASLLQVASSDGSDDTARKSIQNNQKNTANAVVEEIAQLRQSIDQLTSSFSFKRQLIETEVCNIGLCCERALNQLEERSIDVNGVAIECDRDLSIKANGEMLAAALSQLIANALFATRNVEARSVRISAVRTGRDVVVQISDNGIWNNAKTLSAVLKDLELLGKNNTTLGMNISIWILRESGGTLQFLPMQPTGMTAVITFPLLLQ